MFNIIHDQPAARRQHVVRDTVLCHSWTHLKEKVPLNAFTGKPKIGRRSSVEKFIYGGVHYVTD